MIFRILTLSLTLLKKDKNGIRNYVHVKDHISKNKPTLALFTVSLFLLGLLISSNLRNFELIRDLEYTTKKISYLELKVSDLEGDLFTSNTKFVLLSDEHSGCLRDPPPEEPTGPTRSKSVITRKLVIDLLDGIKE